jgi:hypothetical protein
VFVFSNILNCRTTRKDSRGSGDALINDKPIHFKGIATTVVTTAVSAGITYGIGSIATNHIGNFYVRASFQAIAHGGAQGTMAAIQGGNFWTGFASGSISSIMSSAWQGGNHTKVVDGKRYNIADSGMVGLGGANPTDAGTMFFGTISGGAGAALSGGNFWQGAVTGLVVSGLNHTLKNHDSNKFETVYSDKQVFEGNDVFKSIEVVVSYEYTTKKGNYKVLNAEVSTSVNQRLSPIDSYEENKTINGATSKPNITKIGDQIIFKSIGTYNAGGIKVGDFNFQISKFQYSFLGHVNIKHPDLSSIHVTSK